jgi:hypothetical protein
MRRNPDVKSRLGEITRKSAELSASSSKLFDMALQLDRLRRLNGRAALLGNHNCFARRKFHRCGAHKLLENSRDTN